MKFVFSLLFIVIAVSSQAQEAVTYYNAGIDKFEEGNLLGAIKDFYSSLVKNTDFAEAYWGRGSVFAELGQFEKALKDLNQCIKLDPGISDAFYNRAFVYMATDE